MKEEGNFQLDLRGIENASALFFYPIPNRGILELSNEVLNANDMEGHLQGGLGWCKGYNFNFDFWDTALISKVYTYFPDFEVKKKNFALSTWNPKTFPDLLYLL